MSALRIKPSLKRILPLVTGGLLFIWVLFDAPNGFSAGGSWRESTQVVWDEAQKTQVRRVYRVWDYRPDLNLDFTWEQSNEQPGPEGTVSGAGKLTWLKNEAWYSEYEGSIRNGQPEGRGKLVMRSGLTYEGQWSEGLMSGSGHLRFENGDDYSGEFVKGQIEGHGRYGSADGSVYVGEFKTGLRNGAGTLTLTSGATYRSTWESGHEIERVLVAGERSNEPRPPQPDNALSLRVLIDKKKNEEFLSEDREMFHYYVYDSDNEPGVMRVHLDSKKVLGIWKGDDTVEQIFFRDEGHIEGQKQFSPVFLLVDLTNGRDQSIRITRAYLDIETSKTDLQPYLAFADGFEQTYCEPPRGFDPTFRLLNLGWGDVSDVRLTYSFGSGANRTTEYVANLGTFDKSRKISVVDGLRKSHLAIERITGANLSCDSEAELPACLQRIQATGILGDLAGRLFKGVFNVDTNVSGHVDFKWKSVDGQSHEQSSPFSINIPIFGAFGNPECGPLSPVDHTLSVLSLSLDRSNYRVPVNFVGELPSGGNRRFGASIIAPKSSQHAFTLVLELADGTKLTSRRIELNYFMPRLSRKSD